MIMIPLIRLFPLLTLVSLMLTPQPPVTPIHRAAQTAAVMQEWYDVRTGVWNKGLYATGWWNSANNLTALIRYMQLTGDQQYADVITTTYDLNQYGDFTNEFYDDTAWWTLAWIDAYDFSRENRFLVTARNAFAYMTHSWSDRCGGGVQWKTTDPYKNAVTNELFMLTAIRLYIRTEESAYLEWAQRTWMWFEASGMQNASGLINDGLDMDCQNNSQPTYTYNQGIILAALVDLSTVNDDPALMAVAQQIADAAITQLVNAQGVLVDPCEPNCGADGEQFKGIFMRHLAYLRDHTADMAARARYSAFIQHNAESIWNHARNDLGQIALAWSGPFITPSASQQGAALDAFNAAIQEGGP
jgi:predicted alpha-1,6-mannanase (GH76 family)